MRIVLAAVAASAILIGAYLALGGTTYKPTEVANACDKRDVTQVEGTQQVALVVLDGAACELRTDRETLILDVLNGRKPGGASDDELGDALQKGVARAREEEKLGAAEAAALSLIVRVGGAQAVLKLLQR